MLIERCAASEQFVKQNTERINIAARIHVQTAHLSLFRTHVGRCADELLKRGEKCLIGQPPLRGLGDPKIDHLGHRHTIVQSDQNVGGLDVAMDDPFLMRVLDGVANLYEQTQALPGIEFVLVAIIGDFDSANQFHHKERFGFG